MNLNFFPPNEKRGLLFFHYFFFSFCCFLSFLLFFSSFLLFFPLFCLLRRLRPGLGWRLLRHLRLLLLLCLRGRCGARLSLRDRSRRGGRCGQQRTVLLEAGNRLLNLLGSGRHVAICLEDLGDLHSVLLMHRTHRIAQRAPGITSSRRLELALGLLLAVRGALSLALALGITHSQGSQLRLNSLQTGLQRLQHILGGRHFSLGCV
jgi:hypothetical protein